MSLTRHVTNTSTGPSPTLFPSASVAGGRLEYEASPAATRSAKRGGRTPGTAEGDNSSCSESLHISPRAHSSAPSVTPVSDFPFILSFCIRLRLLILLIALLTFCSTGAGVAASCDSHIPCASGVTDGPHSGVSDILDAVRSKEERPLDILLFGSLCTLVVSLVLVNALLAILVVFIVSGGGQPAGGGLEKQHTGIGSAKELNRI